MTIRRFCMIIATLGPVGYFGAPGTVATIVTLPLVYAVHALGMNQLFYLFFVIAFFALSMIIVQQTLQLMKRHDDPSEIVLDEVVGCLLTFWGITLTAQSVVVGFLLFRAFDIMKFGWVKKAEGFTDAWGVIGDDVVAAVIANIMLRLLF